jgi:hypothetical protein
MVDIRQVSLWLKRNRINEKKTLILLMPTTPTATTNLDRNGKKCLQIIYFERWSLLTPFNPFYLGNCKN